jgi:purine nucleoside phosphorylase
MKKARNSGLSRRDLAAGAEILVLTNAAGGIRRERVPPFLMRVEDHLNLQGASPLAPRETGSGSPYDPELGEILDACADLLDLILPSLPTPPPLDTS